MYKGVYFWFTNECLANHGKLCLFQGQDIFMNRPPSWWPSQTSYYCNKPWVSLYLFKMHISLSQPETNRHLRKVLSSGVLLAK